MRGVHLAWCCTMLQQILRALDTVSKSLHDSDEQVFKARLMVEHPAYLAVDLGCSGYDLIVGVLIPVNDSHHAPCAAHFESVI